MASCLFCRIAEKELESRIVYEDDRALCFEDLHPRAPTHLLIIPKKHLDTHLDIVEEDRDLLGHLHLIVNRMARERGLEDGFRVVVNCKAPAGQTVFHLHFHLMGGRPFQWPPG